jgi:signal transduction histidine kinase
VGWATPSNQSEFKKATILLTLYYTAGVFIILAIFNVMVYGLFTNNIKTLEHENKELLRESELQDDFEFEENNILEIQDDLLNILLISDAIIIIFALMIAYTSSKKTLAPLETAYKKQTRFVADAAHELRTPLAVIKAGSEVILRKTRTENEYIKFIEESKEEINRLTNLSNDLLFLAQNNKKKEVLFSEFSFSEICKKQINIMRVYADSKKIKINKSIDDNLMIKGNKDDLIRLIINLTKNAIDYNKEKGEITISLKKINNKIILSVIDTGIGIKKEDLTLIFNRFYKADYSRTQNSSGTGLGLAIIKEIIEEHDGTIKVDSIYNKGTTFTVILNS